ncbi:MAG: c-type cytochrome domain-containing protein, partial [Planctomycetota bacterium]
MFALIQETAAHGSEQALAFLGRLHPLLLHLPIGLFAASALFELLGWFKPSLRPARRLSNVVLALSAAAAAGSGYLLGGEAGYQGELVDDHRMFGILVGVFAGLLALSELRAARAWTIARLTCFSLCAATLYLAGHHGGQLTHGPTFLSEHAPDWLAGVVGPHEEGAATNAEVGLANAAGEPREAEALDPGAAAVVATLTARCVQCHGPNKVKGNLRLDLADGLLSVVEPGLPEESELLRRVLLPRTDAEAMPPKGAALVPEEIDAIETWIAAGAPLESVEAAQAREAELEFAAREQLRSARASSGAKLEPLAQDLELPTAGQRLEVTWLPGARAAEDGASFSALAPVADRIVALRLPQQSLSELALGELPRLPRLERLSLMNARVTGAALEVLADKSPDLRHLNLFGVELDAFPSAAF